MHKGYFEKLVHLDRTKVFQTLGSQFNSDIFQQQSLAIFFVLYLDF